MKKLNIDSLQVESFETENDFSNHRGTAHGYAEVDDGGYTHPMVKTCNQLCPDYTFRGEMDSCITCPGVYPSCGCDPTGNCLSEGCAQLTGPLACP